jgi:hypothetical protein
MSWSLPEVVIRRVVDDSFKKLRANKPAFLDIFADFTKDELSEEYGADYVEQIWIWFTTTKIPVIQSWSFNAQKIPCISVHLANEQEDESKIAFDDFGGVFDDQAETGTAAFSVMLDIGVHANRGGDHVLWLYYILAYVLFKYKPTLVRFGLEMGTFSASDYSKDAEKMGNNIWTRWVRYRCITQNDWAADDLQEPEELKVGMKVSRIGDTEGVEDVEI